MSQKSKQTFVDDFHLREDDETKYTPSINGSFQRGPSLIQDWIGRGEYKVEANRYHLFVNYGCGWCHQVMIARALRGLTDTISLSHLGTTTIGQRGTSTYKGWAIPTDPTGNGFQSAYDVYNSNREYGQNQLTIPILFDKKTKRVVSNDPAHMLLMISCVYPSGDSKAPELYPVQQRLRIEAMNDVIFPGINDGVYRCWFSRSQQAYDAAYTVLRQALRTVDQKLQECKYLCGDQISLADVRAFPHLFRFDVIYHLLMLRDPRGEKLSTYPGIMRWLRDMFRDPRIASTCDLPYAAIFYMSPRTLSAAQCDARYTQERYDWMPSLQEVVAKRAGERGQSS